MEADVLVVGAGIIGTSIARELSKYDLKTVVAERKCDVGFGPPTKANTGIIHAGYDDKPGTLKAGLCAKGNTLWRQIATELDAPFKELGSLVVARKDEEARILEELIERGRKNGVPELEVIYDRARLRAMEPNLNERATAALWAPSAAIASPYELAQALAENAVKNGVKYLLQTEIRSIILKREAVKGAETSKGMIKTRFLVNAAGLESDRISAMVGISRFSIVPRKGEYHLFDKKLRGLVRHVLFPVPTAVSKGIVVTQTVDGNILVGPNANATNDRDDLSTSQEGLEEVLKGAASLVPVLAEKKDMIITSFCGLRPETDREDFVIEAYPEVDGFINAAGMRSPGLTAAPAVALMVVELLRKSGMKMRKKERFFARRKSIESPLRKSDSGRLVQAIIANPKFGRILCRCENVTEAEVLEAVKRGATTLDGVKLRTRAGMGRCQGGFCTHHIIKILSRELKIPTEKITKKGDGSEVLLYKAKQLLLSGEDYE